MDKNLNVNIRNKTLDLNFFINQIKVRYLKSFLQSRSSLLPSYCTNWGSVRISLVWLMLERVSMCDNP